MDLESRSTWFASFDSFMILSQNRCCIFMIFYRNSKMEFGIHNTIVIRLQGIVTERNYQIAAQIRTTSETIATHNWLSIASAPILSGYKAQMLAVNTTSTGAATAGTTTTTATSSMTISRQGNAQSWQVSVKLSVVMSLTTEQREEPQSTFGNFVKHWQIKLANLPIFGGQRFVKSCWNVTKLATCIAEFC